VAAAKCRASAAGDVVALLDRFRVATLAPEDCSMSKRGSLALRLAPLQRVVAQPIVDPAEQARLDKLRAKRRQSERKKSGRAGGRTGSSSTFKKQG
jgi:hypothetical protein